MEKDKEAPPEIIEYYHVLVTQWLPQGWESSLEFVNDEFHDEWLINVYLPGSKREPQVASVPANGSVPHFMIAKCIYTYQKGVTAGHHQANDMFVAKAMAKAATETIEMIHRHSTTGRAVSYHMQNMNTPAKIMDAAKLLDTDNKKENN